MTSFNVKQADWYGTHQACALDTSVGEIFYVSEGGLDTNDGLTPTEPFYTIGAAMAVTAAGRDDYIIVLDYNIDHGENWPLDFNLSDVHLIGTLKSAAKAPSHFVVNTSGNTIQIAADRIEIAGLSLGADGTTGACIIHSGYQAQAHIHHCDLGHTTTCQDGIRLTDSQSWNWEIDHCLFGHDTSGVVRDGIRHAQQAGRMHIHDNVFYVRAGVGIDFLNANFGGIIERNTFKVPDSTDGEAIYIGVYTVVGCTINNNWVASGVESLDNNPYRDVSATANHWGLNYSGLVPTYPVTV